MNEPKTHVIQPQALSLAPGDKYIIAVVKNGTMDLQIFASDAQRLVDSLALASGAIQVFTTQLLQAAEPPSPIVTPFAGPKRMG